MTANYILVSVIYNKSGISPAPPAGEIPHIHYEARS